MIAQNKQVPVATKRETAKIGTNRNSRIAFLLPQLSQAIPVACTDVYEAEQALLKAGIILSSCKPF